MDFNSSIDNYKAQWAQATGGGMAGGKAKPKLVRGDASSSMNFYQDALKEGVQGYADSLMPGLRSQIGTMLGNMNSIGALRSGGVVSGANELLSGYGQQIGAYAKMASEHGADLGFQSVENDLNRKQQEKDRQVAKRNGTLGAIGSALGAGIGLL